MHDFATHEKEIDDIDFSPDSARLLSISKDKVSLDAVGSCFTISLTFQRAIVWDVKKGKKHAELGWESPAGVKYCFKVKKSFELIWKSPLTHFAQRVKFGCVEGDQRKYKVYTISNPVGSSKVGHELMKHSFHNQRLRFFIVQVPAMLHRWNTQSYTVEGEVARFDLLLLSCWQCSHLLAPKASEASWGLSISVQGF